MDAISETCSRYFVDDDRILEIHHSESYNSMNQTTNQAGLTLIESFEGLRLNSHQDSVGVWTTGYGHTEGVEEGQTITQQQAQAFLQQDLGVAEGAVNRLGLTLTDNQFAALAVHLQSWRRQFE